ncbi:unnamed protein product [Dracunculus medinensis]|uniref:Reverse transcriptase n=1 Tax=Dracunculus medinensis TaxID=318479 RepID=A0A0N4UGN2_DRAME|nr:unnamed protein product [Dracunculus medinensis]
MDPYQLKNYIRLEPPIIYSYNSVIGKGNLANEFTSGTEQTPTLEAIIFDLEHWQKQLQLNNACINASNFITPHDDVHHSWILGILDFPKNDDATALKQFFLALKRQPDGRNPEWPWKLWPKNK